MSTKLKIYNIEDQITDSTIFDLADNFCVPAFYEYLRRYRAVNTSSKKADAMSKNIRKLHHKYSSTHKEFPLLPTVLSQSLSNISEESKKLTLISKRTYDAPIRSLVNPFNSAYLNKSLLSQSLGYKVAAIIDGVNSKRFRFNDHKKLSTREYSQILASILYLNWFLTKPHYKRPMVGYMKFLFNPKIVSLYLKNKPNKFIDLILKDSYLSVKKEDRAYLKELVSLDEFEDFIILNSDKLKNFIINIPNPRLNTLKRLYKANIKMGLIDDDLLQRLPMFVLLNDISWSDFPYFKRLFKEGYNRVSHLRFLNDQTIKLIKDKRLSRILNNIGISC